MSRPSGFTEEIAKAICEAVAAGTPIAVAAQAAGVHGKTLRSWKRISEQFNADLAIARAIAVSERIKRIDKAAKGGEEYEVSESVIKHKDGRIERKVTKKKTPPNWSAAAWWLERQECEQFGLNRIELKEVARSLKELQKQRNSR